ncbi:unnamed protein product [Closterium sp. NIES-53]
MVAPTGDTGATAGAGGTGGTAATGPGGARTRGTGAAGTGGVGVAGARDPTEPGAARSGGTRAGSAGAGGAGAGGAGAVDPGAVVAGAGGPGAGGTMRPQPFFVPLLQQVLGLPSSTCLNPPLLCPPPDRLQPLLQPASPMPAPSPYTEQSGGLTERREHTSRPVSPVRTAHRVPRSRPPPVPGMHFSADASALVAELLDFAAVGLVAESESAGPLSVGGECALGTDVLEDRQEDFESLVAAVPHFASMLLAPEGDLGAQNIPTPRSYAEAIEVPPSRANIVDGMWIFRVKRPPSSPPSFKVRYVARGFSQQQVVNYFQTFSPTLKMTTLRVLLHVAAQRDYELHSLDFSTTFLQGSLQEEIWLRRPLGFTGSFPAALGFAPSTADPSLFLRTDTSLPPFYVLVYVDDLVFATADTEALTLVKSFSASASSSPRHSPLLCLSATRSQLHLRTSPTSGMGLVLGGWGPVVLTGHADASWVDDSATQQSSHGYTFSLGSGIVSWRSTRSSSVLSSSCEAEIYAGAMAAQELRWLTYLLTNLGEQPRSPSILYVDNKAMIAFCQQCGQVRLAYVATRANTADIFTKALPPGDHQRFSTVLGLLALLS